MPEWQPSIPLSVAPTRSNFITRKTNKVHFHVFSTISHDLQLTSNIRLALIQL